jgi:pyridoxal phosphate enzyme (YggS family)
MNDKNERFNEIGKRLDLIRSSLDGRSSRPELIAVTKYSPIEDVILAYENNQFDFGENRVQDLKAKSDLLSDKKYDLVRWHFIGHLQTNKVKELLNIPHLYAIHSIDSQKLVIELIKKKNELNQDVEIYFQVNTSHEDEKSGFEDFNELQACVQSLLDENCHLKFKGLMTIATIRTENVDSEALRCFSELLKMKEQLEKNLGLHGLKLSMGMSNDFKIALDFKSNYIRIGSAIFK